jgi:hypothetical protein
MTIGVCERQFAKVQPQPQTAKPVAVPISKPAEHNPGPGAQSAFCGPAATDTR